MKEETLQQPHKLTLSDRKNLTLTGVQEVLSFDEDTVILRTGLGTLIIQGSDLQLKALSVAGGEAQVDGRICSLQYQEPRERKNLWGRLLR